MISLLTCPQVNYLQRWTGILISRDGLYRGARGGACCNSSSQVMPTQPRSSGLARMGQLPRVGEDHEARCRKGLPGQARGRHAEGGGMWLEQWSPLPLFLAYESLVPFTVSITPSVTKSSLRAPQVSPSSQRVLCGEEALMGSGSSLRASGREGDPAWFLSVTMFRWGGGQSPGDPEGP